jgi:hypothetical protein
VTALYVETAACKNAKRLSFHFVSSTDPQVWQKRDVHAWVKWMSDKFSLPDIRPDAFPDNGRDLCRMNRDDFADKAGSAQSGNILATHLAHLRGDPGNRYPLKRVFSAFIPELPDFSRYNTLKNIPNNHKIYQMAPKYTKWP